MVSHYEYAVMANQAYRNPSEDYIPPVGWEVFSTSGTGISINGYFGVAFINHNTAEIVVAHRGTEGDSFSVSDLFADIQLSLNAVPRQYTSSAIPFINTIKQLVETQSLRSYVISHTGHSLGGVLAQLSAGQGRKKAVVFDSPGVREIFENQELSTTGLDITEYLTAPNLIDTVNRHIGKIVRLFPPYNPPIQIERNVYDSSYYASFTLQQHSIENIVSQFSATTGLPKVSSEAGTWPLGGTGTNSGYDTYFRNYNNNPYYWEKYFSLNGFTEKEKQEFIGNYLGGVTQLGGIGVTLTGDNSGNDIWGTTAKKDIVNSGTGNDIHHDFGGDDEYHDLGGTDIYRFKPNNGHDTIDDSDGKGEIIYGGVSLAGVNTAVTFQ